MFENLKHWGRWLAIALVIGLLCSAAALAAKPVVPPPRFSVLELPLRGDAVALSEPDDSGVVTVVIQGADNGYNSAAFARVGRTTRTVLGSGFLPEPASKDPNGTGFINHWSGAGDVNDSGTIVGTVPAYDETILDNRNRAIVWTFGGQNYTYELLPCSDEAEAEACGINNAGDIVGTADGRAVLWDATTHGIVELNSEWTAAGGWNLLSARDINDAGLIVGAGMLDGATRGFVLDRDSGLIVEVPPVGPATSNYAFQVSAFGHVIGNAWDGEGAIWGTSPDYWRGFHWDVLDTGPVVLDPLTDGPSLVRGMNDYGVSAGSSVIPSDDFGTIMEVPTLWEFDAQGKLLATDLNTQIPTKPAWYLWHSCDVNNDGWVSGYGRKYLKGQYYWRAVLLVPTAN